MAGTSDTLINLIFLISAGFMILILLKLRQRNMLVNTGHFDEEYTGEAINPNQFMEPDEEALEEMQELLDSASE
ncbi:MAG: hypothetical protein ACKVI6_04320 [Candidatus Poseidoniales archaeon]|jgi:hypothetical protein|tara:strand:+ start:4462 stop:4683 length:222 start_codon:yes stop_codon:yes gene_type:complete